MTLRDTLARAVRDAASRTWDGVDLREIAISVPRVRAHGDYTTNAALKMAGVIHRPAMELAREVAAAMPDIPAVTRIEVQPPGFINFFVRDTQAACGLGDILRDGAAYGNSNRYAGRRALVAVWLSEPGQLPPLSRLRPAAVGDAVAQALRRVGYAVRRQRLGHGVTRSDLFRPNQTASPLLVQRDFDLVVNVAGPDRQDLPVLLQAARQALGVTRGEVSYTMCQHVTVSRGCHKTAPPSVPPSTLRDIIAAVGADALRFFLNARRSSSHMVFDLDLATETSAHNLLHRVKSLHAACRAVERHAAAHGFPIAGSHVAPQRLVSDEEQELTRTLLDFPLVVDQAGGVREPRQYFVYLQTLADQLDAWLAAGRISRDQQIVLADNAALTQARLLLAMAAATVLRNALGVFGIEAPDGS